MNSIVIHGLFFYSILYEVVGIPHDVKLSKEKEWIEQTIILLKE